MVFQLPQFLGFFKFSNLSKFFKSDTPPPPSTTLGDFPFLQMFTDFKIFRAIHHDVLNFVALDRFCVVCDTRQQQRHLTSCEVSIDTSGLLSVPTPLQCTSRMMSNAAPLRSNTTEPKTTLVAFGRVAHLLSSHRPGETSGHVRASELAGRCFGTSQLFLCV